MCGMDTTSGDMSISPIDLATASPPGQILIGPNPFFPSLTGPLKSSDRGARNWFCLVNLSLSTLESSNLEFTHLS